VLLVVIPLVRSQDFERSLCSVVLRLRCVLPGVPEQRTKPHAVDSELTGPRCSSTWKALVRTVESGTVPYLDGRTRS
jgi:hypothetical protein